MKYIRKFGALLIAVCMLTTGMVNCAQADTKVLTRDEKASFLNSLQILKGNGTNFGLDSQLKRSEAAAFIVRILGVETEVLTNKSKYSYTSYSDVSPDEWYAPYIGYCNKYGIIDGYADKTFKPNDYLSEKAFLKMLLATLNYAYNVDYTWNSVYSLSYTVGLVTDSTYLSKTVDNTKYTRGAVVDALFLALKAETKGTKVKLIQKFIDVLLISKEKAIEYGLIVDNVQTSIQSIKAVSEYVIEVSFNETVQDLLISNLLISNISNANLTLTAKSILKSEGGLKYTITLNEKQQPDQAYGLLITQVTDTYGNVVSSLNNEFTGFRPAIIKSDYFMISNIEPVSNNTLNVYFTQPINDNMVQPNYLVLKKLGINVVTGSTAEMQVTRLSSCNNGIGISLKNFKFTTQDTYELVVDGKATSTYGVKLKDGLGDSIKFKPLITENTPLEVLQTSTPNNYTIQLDFNKVINEVLAKQIYTYYLTTTSGSPIQISKAEVDETGKSIRITTGLGLTQNQKYKLMINNLNDSTRQFYITEKSYDFTAVFASVSNVKIETVFPYDSNTLMLYVDRPLDYESATNIANYQINGVTDSSYMAIPSAVFYDQLQESQLLKIYLPESKALNGTKAYELRLMNTVKDAAGNIQSTMLKYTFVHNGSKLLDASITDARIVGENTIKLSFSKEIALDITNILNTNYSLTYVEDGTIFKKTPIGANYIDAKTMILKFDALDMTKTYAITFNKLVNYGLITTDNTLGKYSLTVVKGQ